MGNRPDEQIDKDVIIKIVKERLIQHGDKKEIFNSLLKLGFSKEEADSILKTSIQELENICFSYNKSGYFLNIVICLIFIIVLGLLFYFCFIK
jgi:hypothetical protein